jgi:hypothetical protein
MTIHAPAHPGGVTAPQVQSHHLARLAAVGAAVVLAFGILLVGASVVRTPTATITTQDSFLEYRTAERASWSATANPSRDSFLDFRAAERASWSAGASQPQPHLGR